MKANKRRIVLALILVATITISVLGTYAYFLTQGNDDNVEQKLTVKTGTLALTFEDNDAGINQSIMLGESVTKEFIIRNTGVQAVTTNMYWINLTNTYLKESLSYKLEYKTSEDGTWTDVDTTTNTNIPRSLSAATKELASNLTIPANEVYYYKLTIKFENLEDINQEPDRTASLSTKFMIGNENENVTITPVTPVKATITNLNMTPKIGNPSFASAATTDEGVYSMADDYGTSYYYRGAVTNNYVKFGGFYWRIIRINGDGSVRMIYDGTEAYDNANGGTGSGGTDRYTHTGKKWNANYIDAKYVGWKFGGNDGEASTSRAQATTNTTDSDLKEVVDAWYKTNIADKNLGKYVSDEIFCNDRSLGTTDSTYTNKGFGNTPTSFAARNRFYLGAAGYVDATPKFTCTQKNDAFTVSDTTRGNGSLTYPVGLITADEIVAAGSGKLDAAANKYYYLYKNSSYWYWSLSPYHTSTSGVAYMFNVKTDGGLGYVHMHSSGGIAPVINISAEYAATLTGSGTMSSPYQIPGVE